MSTVQYNVTVHSSKQGIYVMKKYILKNAKDLGSRHLRAFVAEVSKIVFDFDFELNKKFENEMNVFDFLSLN